jgi:signal transduction histidine kinase
MIKSLYVRVVIIFIGAVIVSLTLAFFLATQLYSSNLKRMIEENMIESGKRMIQALQHSNNDTARNLLDGIIVLPGFRITLFNPQKEAVYYDDGGSSNKALVSVNQIDLVLKGAIYRGAVQSEKHGPPSILIGLPFRMNKQPYALFISPEISQLLGQFRTMLFTVLITVLILGSFFILLAARYIVKPVQQLTEATRRMAKGNFQTELKIKRRDEIGVLTLSFQEMAGELQMLDQMRRDFVNNVSHEIQSPLTSITGFTKALKEKQIDEPSRLHYLTIIEEESERLSRLSSNLLRLSMLQYEHHPFHPEKFQLDEQLRHIVIASEPQWSSKQIEMDLQLEEMVVLADKDQLSQVWNNLITNSIKFSPERAAITISLIKQEGSVLVTIADNGKGIPDEELQHIWVPFYKVDKSRDNRVAGSGLGLSIVKRIIDIHQGEIQVTSKIGQGTIFTIQLPAM